MNAIITTYRNLFNDTVAPRYSFLESLSAMSGEEIDDQMVVRVIECTVANLLDRSFEDYYTFSDTSMCGCTARDGRVYYDTNNMVSVALRRGYHTVEQVVSFVRFIMGHERSHHAHWAEDRAEVAELRAAGFSREDMIVAPHELRSDAAGVAFAMEA